MLLRITRHHLRCSMEANRLALLLDRHGRQKDWNDSILTEWHTVVWMTGDLQDELCSSSTTRLKIDFPPHVNFPYA